VPEPMDPSRPSLQPPSAQVNDQKASGQATAPYIVVEAATKIYQLGSREVLGVRGVSFVAEKGQLVAVCGRSGSGKTTLLKLIGGLDRPTAGRVLVGGHDVGAMSEEQLMTYRWKTVGFLFQHVALLSLYSAWENVALPLWSAGYPKAEAKTRALSCLERVGLVAQQNRRPPELARDEQQRIGIARALALQHAVLLADEPTDHLDLRTGLDMIRLLRQIAEEEQMAVLVATPDWAMLPTAHRVLELRDGQCVDSGRAWRHGTSGCTDH
jgi:putative ABC transport system ATP-binding protein